MTLPKIQWADFPQVRGKTSCLIVKVGNQSGKDSKPTYSIKDLLQASGYQPETAGGWWAWAKSFPAENFSIEVLQGEIWAATADGIEVRIFDDHDALVAQYLVNADQWICVLDTNPQTQEDTT
jgi:DNA helicase-4